MHVRRRDHRGRRLPGRDVLRGHRRRRILMPLTTQLDVNLSAALTSALDLVTASAPTALNTRITMASGITTGKADVCWSDTRTVAASGTDALDLAGSLTGLLGG